MIRPVDEPRRPWSRREFWATAGTGVAALALPACFGDSGSSGASLGGIADPDGGAGDLATGGGTHDLETGGGRRDLASRGGSIDMAESANLCPGGVFDTGQTPSKFPLGSATLFDNQGVFVSRDGGGLFAMSSICTHAACTPAPPKSLNDRFHCHCHGATFAFDGSDPTAPAPTPLDHYALCITQAGTVGFDSNTIVDRSQRLNV